MGLYAAYRVVGKHAGSVVYRAEELPEGAWEELNRKPKYPVKTEERQKPEKHKKSR